jgi:hypothetical protein
LLQPRWGGTPAKAGRCVYLKAEGAGAPNGNVFIRNDFGGGDPQALGGAAPDSMPSIVRCEGQKNTFVNNYVDGWLTKREYPMFTEGAHWFFAVSAYENTVQPYDRRETFAKPLSQNLINNLVNPPQDHCSVSTDANYEIKFGKNSALVHRLKSFTETVALPAIHAWTGRYLMLILVRSVRLVAAAPDTVAGQDVYVSPPSGCLLLTHTNTNADWMVTVLA